MFVCRDIPDREPSIFYIFHSMFRSIHCNQQFQIQKVANNTDISN
jgi:hypothetical protein